MLVATEEVILGLGEGGTTGDITGKTSKPQVRPCSWVLQMKEGSSWLKAYLNCGLEPGVMAFSMTLTFIKAKLPDGQNFVIFADNPIQVIIKVSFNE